MTHTRFKVFISSAGTWIIFAGLLLITYAFLLFIAQCAFFAYYDSWPALPATLLFTEHGDWFSVQNDIKHPAFLVPNIFDTGSWNTWTGVWHILEIIPVHVVLIFIGIAVSILGVVMGGEPGS